MARGIAEEDDLDAATGEFLEYENLIRIFPRESVRIEDVEAIDDAGGGLVPEPFEARAGQDVPAAAIVNEAQLGLAFQGVTGDAPLTASSWLAIVPSLAWWSPETRA